MGGLLFSTMSSFGRSDPSSYPDSINGRPYETWKNDQNNGFDHDLVDTPLHSHALIKFVAIFKVRTISMPMGGIEAFLEPSRRKRPSRL